MPRASKRRSWRENRQIEEPVQQGNAQVDQPYAAHAFISRDRPDPHGLAATAISLIPPMAR